MDEENKGCLIMMVIITIIYIMVSWLWFQIAGHRAPWTPTGSEPHIEFFNDILPNER